MTDTFPPWARWIAQDAHGDICVYDKKPILIGNFWLSNRYQHGIVKFITKGTPNPHWQHSLDWLGDDDETI